MQHTCRREHLNLVPPIDQELACPQSYPFKRASSAGTITSWTIPAALFPSGRQFCEFEFLRTCWRRTKESQTRFISASLPCALERERRNACSCIRRLPAYTAARRASGLLVGDPPSRLVSFKHGQRLRPGAQIPRSSRDPIHLCWQNFPSQSMSWISWVR